MTETKPKIEGKHHSSRPARNGGLARKEFVTKELGLESHSFDIGNWNTRPSARKQGCHQGTRTGEPFLWHWKCKIRSLVPENRGRYCQPHPEGVQGRTRDCKGIQRLESAYDCNHRVPKTILNDSRGWPRRGIPVAAGCHQGKEKNCAPCREQEGLVRPHPRPMLIRAWVQDQRRNPSWLQPGHGLAPADHQGALMQVWWQSTKHPHVRKRKALRLNILPRLRGYNHGVHGTVQGTAGCSWDLQRRIWEQARANQGPAAGARSLGGGCWHAQCWQTEEGIGGVLRFLPVIHDPARIWQQQGSISWRLILQTTWRRDKTTSQRPSSKQRVFWTTTRCQQVINVSRTQTMMRWNLCKTQVTLPRHQ